ncbi:hypothetical protein ABZZ80_02395 [Streptomyces sp. NPDC006356]
MPDTISKLAKQLAGLARRVTVLERACRVQPPAWRDLPLTGNTEIADASSAPQLRLTKQNTLELSGQINISDEKIRDESVLALLPDDYRPTVLRRVSVASDAGRRIPYLEIHPDGRVLARLSSGASVRASFISLDGVDCRLNSADSE